jgi:hypothetical protein
MQNSVRQQPANLGYQRTMPTRCLAGSRIQRDDDIAEKVWGIERLSSDIPLNTE